MRSFAGFVLAIATVLVISACTSPAPAPPPAPVYDTTRTIKEVMKSMVEPAADTLWNSVATNVTTTGTEVKAPQNDKDWLNVRREAIVLIEAMNLITMPERHMAPPGTKSDNPGSELEPDQIQALVTQDRESFTKLAHALQDTGLAALKAIDAKDTEALNSAGGDIDMACESCHTKYWYPNKKAS
jgi:cytochrome c556